MILAATAVVFVALLLLSLPIVFCLGAAAVTGLWLGGYPMQQLGSSMIAASQSWVLLAIPSFVFAGSLMERAGMSHSLVELARAHGRLAARRPWHVGNRGLVFLLRHLRLEDGRGIRARLCAGAAAAPRRLSRRGRRIADRRRHRHGHAGAAGDLHDRHRRRNEPIRRRTVPGGLHPGCRRRTVPVHPGADPGAHTGLAEGYRDKLASPAARRARTPRCRW